MSIYKYRAKKEGENVVVEGFVDAETVGIAEDILIDKNLLVLSLVEKKYGFGSLDLSKYFSRVKDKDLVIFSRQLSIMISANVPLVQALKDIVVQTKNLRLKTVIAGISAEVEGGVRFSEALDNYRDVFDNFFVNIIKSGEMSGRLDEVLLYLADQLEKDYDLRSKIRGAMIYPAFVVGGLLVIGILMMIFVVPELTQMLEQTGGELPTSTMILKKTSDFFVDYWWALFLGIGCLSGGYVFLNKKPEVKIKIDRFKLGLPVFGKITHYISTVQFVRGLRTLMIGGVDLVSALGVTAEIMNNLYYREVLLKTKTHVENGGRLAEILFKEDKIPKMVPQMIETGEETGKIELVLKKIGEFYAKEVENMTRNIMSLLEPVIMVVLGIAVAIMIMAVILPMYQISTNM